MVHECESTRMARAASPIPKPLGAINTAPPRIVDRSEREVGDRLALLPPGHAHIPAASADGQTQAVAWHTADGNYLAVAWDLATGRERCRFTLGPGIWENIAVSPDGSRASLLGSPPEMPGKPHTPQFARIVDLNTGKVVWSSEAQGVSRSFRVLDSIPTDGTWPSPRGAA